MEDYITLLFDYVIVILAIIITIIYFVTAPPNAAHLDFKKKVLGARRLSTPRYASIRNFRGNSDRGEKSGPC